MQWGPDSDAKLFMHMLKIHNIKPDYQALALAMGEDVTAKAISHRIAKLKSIAEEKAQALTITTPTVTPAKSTRRTTAAAAKSPNSSPSTGPSSVKKSTHKGANATALGSKRTATGKSKTATLEAYQPGMNADGEETSEGAEVLTPSKKIKTEDDNTGADASALAI